MNIRKQLKLKAMKEIETHLEKKPVSIPAVAKKPQAKPEPVYEAENLGSYLLPGLDLLIEP